LSKLFQISVKENRQVAQGHFLLTAHPLDTIPAPNPGQFFMISVDSRLDPLLKRPFSLHRFIGGDLQFLYRVVGKATSIIIGMGGIISADDAIEFMLAGASAVAIGTGNFINPGVTMDVLSGIKSFMSAERLNSLKELTGRVEC